MTETNFQQTQSPPPRRGRWWPALCLALGVLWVSAEYRAWEARDFLNRLELVHHTIVVYDDETLEPIPIALSMLNISDDPVGESAIIGVDRNTFKIWAALADSVIVEASSAGYSPVEIEIGGSAPREIKVGLTRLDTGQPVAIESGS